MSKYLEGCLVEKVSGLLFSLPRAYTHTHTNQEQRKGSIGFSPTTSSSSYKIMGSTAGQDCPTYLFCGGGS